MHKQGLSLVSIQEIPRWLLSQPSLWGGLKWRRLFSDFPLSIVSAVHNSEVASRLPLHWSTTKKWHLKTKRFAILVCEHTDEKKKQKRNVGKNKCPPDREKYKSRWREGGRRETKRKIDIGVKLNWIVFAIGDRLLLGDTYNFSLDRLLSRVAHIIHQLHDRPSDSVLFKIRKRERETITTPGTVENSR